MSIFSQISVIFTTLFFIFYSSDGKIISWTDKHNICTASVDDIGGMSHKSCAESDYMLEMHAGLLKPRSNYQKEVYQAIYDMYTRLEVARVPRPVTITGNDGLSVTLLIHSISFGIPEEDIITTFPSKIKSFGQVIPGVYSTYFHLNNESLYFEDMKKSLFTLTHKKGGWDCLRHYEILAMGSIPLFPGIGHCPNQTLSAHPKELYHLFLQYPGLTLHATRINKMTMNFHQLQFDMLNFDELLYKVIVKSLTQYTRNILSTNSMVSYMIERMIQYSNHTINLPLNKVLYLTHQDHDMDKGDYLTDMILHGLKALYGTNKIIDFPMRRALYNTIDEFNHTNYLLNRNKLYGKGFTIGSKYDEYITSTSTSTSLTNERDSKIIESNIINHKYDLIILGSGHRDGYASKLYFWDLICKHYNPLKVGFIDGSDLHITDKMLKKYYSCAGHLFSREGYAT